ncbi:MAG: putative bifunctional diguanylate cyclase/phosphodiesterase [Geminicoccaceae bacterium]
MLNVVVIDAVLANRNILTRLAMSVEEGIRVKTFAAPRLALAWFANTLPDLVIADCNLAEMSGSEFIRAFRALPRMVDVPLVVIVGREDRDDGYRALESGASDFVTSPVNQLEFQTRARNLLTMRKQQKLLKAGTLALRDELEQRSEFGERPADEHRLHRLIDSTPILINSVDSQGRLTHVNEAHRPIYGVDPASLIGGTLADLYGAEDAMRHQVLNDKVFESGERLESFEQDILLPDGAGRRVLLTTKSPRFDEAGSAIEVITASLEITELKRNEEAMRRQMDHDPLTDLPNRSVFRAHLENALIRARRRQARCAVLIVDLDRFKGINDAFGLPAGDLLLQRVAERLSTRLREIDVIGRLGGDEFVILQNDIRRQTEAEALARQLSDSFGDPFIINGEELHISASIGITLFPNDGQSADRLLKNAELAKYRAKSIGRNTNCFYSPRMNQLARRTGLLERELRQAVAGRQFTVHYQPQRAVGSGRIRGMEALLRWCHPRRGMVRPTEFIGLAETIGLINPITECVLEQSCKQHRLWIEAGLPALRLSVNLSPIQFREEGIVELVESALKRTGIEPENLEIELTEGVMFENSKVAIDSLTRLNDLGVTFSLDDFGTGYSSLSYVRRLPVHRLKIDQSFVHRLGQDGQDDAIVRTIIDLGHSLDLQVTAEGVETRYQLDRLRELGCDEVQGDLISPPLPPDRFAALLAEKVAAERRAAEKGSNVTI